MGADWMSVIADIEADWISAVADVVQAIAVVIATTLAIRGINDWRRQMLGKRKVEIAEQTLVATYKVQGAMAFIRSPAGYEGEGKTRTKAVTEAENLARVLDGYFVPIERIRKASEDFAEFLRLRLLCKVHFGSKSAEPFDEILKARDRVVLAANMLSMTAEDRLYGEKTDLALFREWQSLIWDMGDEDLLTPTIRAAVGRIEEICGRHLI